MSLPIPPMVGTVLSRLRHASHQAYIVGGAVRDTLLGRPVTDWDVATSADTRTIRHLFRDKRCIVLKHHTVTVVGSEGSVEVTPFRGAESGLPADLSHRDFTLNAMAADMEGETLIDPHGGCRDIRLRLIRAVHDPVARFQEDPIRLLRAVRLQAELEYAIESETLAAISVMAPWITSTATERIRDEILKMLVSKRPSQAFTTLHRTGLLAHLIPELLEGHLMRQNPYHRYTVFKHTLQTLDRVAPTLVLRTAALLHDIAKPRVRTKVDGIWRFHGHEAESSKMAETILSRLKFNKDLIKKVAHLIRHHLIGYAPNWSDAAVRRLIQRVGKENIPELLALRRADLTTHVHGAPALHQLNALERRIKAELGAASPTEVRDLRINGRTVMRAAGIPQGPQVGRMLRYLTERVLENPALNTEQQLVDMVMRVKASAWGEENKS